MPHDTSKLDTLFAEWAKIRAAAVDPNDDQPDDAFNKTMDRQAELAILITTTPALTGEMIELKIEVLDHHMSMNHGSAAYAHPEAIMLAGVKADITRFKLAGAFG